MVKIIYDINTPVIKSISFFKYDYNNICCEGILTYYIINNPYPMLRLNCCAFYTIPEFYEYTINYIINNKIGKYNALEINQHNDTIFAYFDIVNSEILLQLI